MSANTLQLACKRIAVSPLMLTKYFTCHTKLRQPCPSRIDTMANPAGSPLTIAWIRYAGRCTHVCIHAYMNLIHVCACLHAWIYLQMHVKYVFACMFLCMYVCICIRRRVSFLNVFQLYSHSLQVCEPFIAHAHGQFLMIRDWLRAKGYEALIVTSEDAHQSEYVADCDKKREFVSGFSGSAGTAVIRCVR